ncbi:MAG: STAS domain-containing protein [Fibrobacteraceae bacterium]|nr:STAS domain-containing protein [Fibrobacteraceae bacterium]
MAAQIKNYREVGVFDLLSAPLTPVGIFDAEQFKKDIRTHIDSCKEEKYVAVDLTGLDFVYSDGCNAFIQYEQELSKAGGVLAVLTSNKIVVDCLRKAGLDKKLRIFASESEMMSFSLHRQAPEDELQGHSSDEGSSSSVASRNINGEPIASEPRKDRTTGSHRRFTKSFNAIAKEEKLSKKGLDTPFEEEKSPLTTILAIVGCLIVLGGALVALLS